MKKSAIFVITGVLGFALFVAQGCSVSTANMGSLKTSKDKDGKTEASSFTTGDMLYANAEIANNPGKVKVKFSLVAEDVKGLTKGDTLKGSEVTVDIEGDGRGQYSVPVTPGFLGGTYKLNADMLDEKGEKKDGKSANVTVTQKAPEPKTAEADEDAEDK